MKNGEKINYIEFPAKDMVTTRKFFTEVFGWVFMSYGPQYTAFSDPAIEGGFYESDQVMRPETGSALIVFYSDDLEKTQKNILNAGGEIIKPTFSFPGGKRFHFADPNGNEFAVWSR